MPRPRKPANERLPQYVERRADGNLRLRYPVPADVRDAFPGRDGQGQRVVTRSLGTTDPRVARPELTRLLAELDARVRRARAQTVSDEALEGHLRRLYSSTLAVADEIADSEADKERLRLFGAALPPPNARGLREKLEAARREPLDLDQFRRWRVEAGRDIAGNGAEPTQARIGLVVDRIFEAEVGFVPSRESESYQNVTERVASVLLDGIQGQLARMEGRVEPKPRDQALVARPKESREGNRPLTEAAELKVSAYYNQVYLHSKSQLGADASRSARIKSDSVSLFSALVGDRRLYEISKADLNAFRSALHTFPERRFLTEEVRKLRDKPDELMKLASAGRITTPMVGAATIIKHLRGVTSILRFASSCGDIAFNPSQGMQIQVPTPRRSRRAFTP